MDEYKKRTPDSEVEDVLVVDDGFIRIPVYNQVKEQIGVFKFNPTDINIINRYNEVAEKFGEVVEPLNNAGVNENGEGVDEESIELLNAAEDRMIELFDYMLGSDSREAFFSKVHVFSPVDGKFYCENVFAAIGAYISKKFDSEINKISTRIDKHTHGYRTGKHKRGDR